ncbi:RNA-binding S4 domain-containing protein [Pelagimonas varians]|uniref:Heat shock protein 15 n=1 Tax=Pelagimonas varians TaxID=696760 RepID=A0A238KXE2_9RHOB|nr:RNA-binding S4 domain-containing protein [Pelagimonas varians]PYG27752.1 heat shock protein Hsp15 [Pelagimonas varians]SMX47387.1 Heat shock protein 15 [Pelagimonas varians]
MAETPERIRIDKWLWQARFFKTRSLSAKLVSGGHCRVNSMPVSKPAYGVSTGDVLTFSKEDDVRVIKVLALGTRRGPAVEAQTLYEDLAPPQPRERPPSAPKFDGGGRPSKRDRRALEQLRRDVLE